MRVGGDLFGERAIAEYEAVAERVADERLEVGRNDVVAAADQGQRPAGGDKRDRPARAGAVRDEVGDLVDPVLARPARRGGDVDGPADQRRIDVDLADATLELGELVDRQHLMELGGILERASDDGQFFVMRRVVDEHLEHEPVDLRLRQRVRPF